MYQTASSYPAVEFQSTSTMMPTGSRLSSTVYPVGVSSPYASAPAPAYAAYRAPGTGGYNPPGYDDTGGTGFPLPLGDGVGLLMVLILVYWFVKKSSGYFLPD